MPDTHVEIMITNEVVSLISYSLVAVASKPQIPGSSFLGERQHGVARKDFLQVRRAPLEPRYLIYEAEKERTHKLTLDI